MTTIISTLLLFSTLASVCLSQCPIAVDAPCRCSRSIYEPITILCDNARSLDEALRAISRAGEVQIDSLTIKNTPIPRLQANAFAGFTIIRLVLNKNQLNQIDDRAFDGQLLDSMLELDLKDNQLGAVPQTALPKLRNLQKLYLSNNRISALSANAFQNWESREFLIKLDMSQNQIGPSGFRQAAQAFRPLRNLEELSLEANALGSLPIATSALGAQRNSLKNLNLGLNNITEVPINALEFPALESLSLEFNGIPFIQAEAFRGVRRLLFLYVTGNKFSQWPKEMFRYIDQLKILGIGETGIPLIPQDAFEYTPQLMRLEMSEAAVKTIQPGAFQRTPDIQTIVMNGNRLEIVPVTMFRGLNRVQSIDLQSNQLRRVDDSAFANLPALRHLDISRNRLTTLQPNTFSNTLLPTPDARVLYVCENPWSCAGSLAWFRQWLRDNPSIIIDKVPGCDAVCAAAPEWFPPRLPLRSPDPPRPTTTTLPPQPIVRAGIDWGWIILAVILSILFLAIILLAVARYFISRRHKNEKDEIEEEAKFASAASAVGAGSMVAGPVYTPSPYPAGTAGGYGTSASVYPASAVGAAADLDLPQAHTLDDDRPTYFVY